MQLLLQRRQGKNWIGLSIFKLWAKFDLTGEETALIEKYQVQGYILSEGNFREFSIDSGKKDNHIQRYKPAEYNAKGTNAELPLLWL